MNHEKPINILLFAALGATFWVEGVLFIRFLGEHLFVQGNPWILSLFVGSIPISWVLVKIGAAIGNVNGENLLTATALMSLTALLLDGIGLTWFQNWYHLEPEPLLLAAAWLLWAAGLGLAIGYWESRRDGTRTDRPVS